MILLSVLGVVSACSDGDGHSGPPASLQCPSDNDADDSDAKICVPRGERAHDLLEAPHVSSVSCESYNSNPPSSGPHCAGWGRYVTFTPELPLSRCHWVHNLEHGGVVLLYNCPDGCAEIVEALQRIIDEAPPDPDGCSKPRFVLTPDPHLDSKVAAAAWGFTWEADCLDEAARVDLAAFAERHRGSRGQSPEATVCGEGSIGP